ncbi:aldehyde dehydrogenase family protein [Paenibacillus sp. NPDC057934]|uniref:aldehyde dehydrogenase family protein n=1 Tax=Paenibacillus sp. NPDC057934 TaxID=3346282 RepID=UPI0036D9BE37
MKSVDKIYINGSFVKPHGEELFDLFNPVTGKEIGSVILADAVDTRNAILAAKKALVTFSKTTKQERIKMLQRLHDAVVANESELTEVMLEEYGAPLSFSSWAARYAAESFLNAAKTLNEYPLVRNIGTTEVVMEPVGVVGLITPWNSNYSFICNKLSMAIAAGCTAVIKPSEMSALQTYALTECLHQAGLPAGVFNIVTGRGDVVGAEISSSPDVSKISFTGSTLVGKTIMRASAETLKRVTLELGGKSPTIILEDADLSEAVKQVVAAGFINSGQACLNGTRVLVPAARLDEFYPLIKEAIGALKVGDPHDPSTTIGPMVSQKQYERVQHYINLGIEEGANVLVGGAGKPDGLEDGFFIKPTVFINVTNDMTIAKEEIFGPVIAVISYKTEEEAIQIANDTIYGLQSFVVSGSAEHARVVASQIQSGRVTINGAPHDQHSPFGGFKQSGIGREYGVFGLESYLEAKAISTIGTL